MSAVIAGTLSLPFVLVVAAIAAAVAAFIWLDKEFNIFGGRMVAFADQVIAAWNGFINFWGTIPAAMQGDFEPLLKWFETLFDGIFDVVMGVVDAIKDSLAWIGRQLDKVMGRTQKAQNDVLSSSLRNDFSSLDYAMSPMGKMDAAAQKITENPIITANDNAANDDAPVLFSPQERAVSSLQETVSSNTTTNRLVISDDTGRAVMTEDNSNGMIVTKRSGEF